MKVVTFGEILLRLTPPLGERLTNSGAFAVTCGGAEANVACSLSLLGDQAAFVSRLPDSDIGEKALAHLRSFGVDVTGVVKKPHSRMGLYYYEQGYDCRPAKVVYDRAGSAFAQSEPCDYDWPALFAGADWFHVTGITPAVGGALPEITKQAVKAAKNAGVKVSFDPNYRAALWTKEEAGRYCAPLLPDTDLLIVNEAQAEGLFAPFLAESCPSLPEEDAPLAALLPAYAALAERLYRAFHFKRLALTRRRTLSAEQNRFAAFYFDAERARTCGNFAACTVASGNVASGNAACTAAAGGEDMTMIDRVGGGDAFAAGLLHAIGQKKSTEDAVAFAVAAARLAHSFTGDVNLATEGEILALAQHQKPTTMR